MIFQKVSNYREFVRLYLQQKAPNGRGEIARLAEHMRVHSTFVSQVLGATKEFSMEQSYAVAEYLELTPVEKKFFLLLVQRDRAGTKELRQFFQAELEEIKNSTLKISNRLREHKTLSDVDKAVFYSSWLYSAIRLYCSAKGGLSLEEIARYFKISRQKALPILNFLCEKDLVVLERDRYKMGTLHTHLPNDSPFILRHHMNWRTKALQRHESLSPEEVAFTAPMAISKAAFHEIREKILTCIKESIEIAKASETEELVFLNIDWLKAGIDE